MLDKADWGWSCYPDLHYKTKQLDKDTILEVMFGTKRGGNINVWRKGPPDRSFLIIHEKPVIHGKYYKETTGKFMDWENAMLVFKHIKNQDDLSNYASELR